MTMTTPDIPPDLTLPVSAYTTRTEAQAALAAQGIHGEAAEELLRSTSSTRHAHRIRRYREGGLAEYARVTGKSLAAVLESSTPDAAMHGITAILFDAFGVGSVEPGQKSQHHRAFSHGCGPRFGGPSGAYSSAAHAALLWLWGKAFGTVPATPTIYLLPSPAESPERYLTFVFGDGDPDDPGNAGELDLDVHPDMAPDGLDCPPPLWLLAVAREGMRRAAGLSPRMVIGPERDAHLRTTSPSPLDLVRGFIGTAADWAGLVNEIERRRRVDEIAGRFGRVVRDYADRYPDRPALLRAPEGGPKRVVLSDLAAWLDALPIGAAAGPLRHAIGSDLTAIAVEAMLRAALDAAVGGA